MDTQPTSKWKIITADHLVLGTDTSPITDGIVVIHGDQIQAVGRKGQVELPDVPDVERIDVPSGKTVLPGMVDVHTHLVMPGDSTPYQEFMRHDDGILLMQAALNARKHLISGVTTVSDTGARGSVTFTLRNAINLGLMVGPRLILCGRPLTRTGGHCWFLGAEADGPDEIGRVTRQLLKEGADIIKVMATGGGTAGTYPYRPSLRVEELSAAVAEAHANGKKAIAHVSATEGIRRALDAQFDVIFHSHFYNSDGTLSFQSDVASRIADSGVLVNPTLHVNGVYVELLRRKAAQGGLDAQEQAVLDARASRYRGQLENVGKLVEHGVKLVAGSDAGWGSYPFGDLVREMEEMVRVGMSAEEVLIAATSRAADALGIGDMVGSISPGKKADLLIVEGDPTRDIGALRSIVEVFLGGTTVDRRGHSWLSTSTN